MLQNLTQGKRLIFLIIGAFVLLGAIGVTIYQVQRSQESRSRASSAPPVTVKLEPSSSVVRVGDQIAVNIKVKAGSNDLGAVSGTIDFSKAISDGLFEYVDFSQATLLPFASPGVNKIGSVTFIGTNTTITPVTGDNVSLGKLILMAKKPGIGKITLHVQFTATGQKEFVPQTNATLIETDITIDGPLSPTPACTGTANLPPGCQCYRDAECTTGYSCQQVNGSQAGYCVSATGTPYPTSIIHPSTTVVPSVTPTPTYRITTTPTLLPSPTPTHRLTPTATPMFVPSPTVSVVPSATPTLVPSHTALNVTLTLPGIGPKTSSNNDNPNPIHKTRSATLKVYNSTDTLVKTMNQNLSWDGKFLGNFDLGTGFTSGTYRITIALNNTLYKQVSGIANIIAGQRNSLPETRLITGDINQNNRMDTLDYNLFVACYQAKASCTTEQKALADFNDNGEFDIFDNAIIVNAFLNVEGD